MRRPRDTSGEAPRSDVLPHRSHFRSSLHRWLTELGGVTALVLPFPQTLGGGPHWKSVARYEAGSIECDQLVGIYQCNVS
jgi:hypothetical protein